MWSPYFVECQIPGGAAACGRHGVIGMHVTVAFAGYLTKSIGYSLRIAAETGGAGMTSAKAPL